jgi:hypothetical protein
MTFLDYVGGGVDVGAGAVSVGLIVGVKVGYAVYKGVAVAGSSSAPENFFPHKTESHILPDRSA